MTALRPMQLDAPVGRPETALDSGGWSGAEILGGVAAVVLIPLIVASIIAFLYLGSIVGAAVLTILSLVAVAIIAALSDEASLALTVVAGAGALMLIPAVILGLMIVLVLISDTVAEIGASAIEPDREQILEEEDVIEARFVQLGRDFEDELPNREVPLLNTAPQELAEVPTEDTPDEPPEDVERPEEQPPDAAEDDVLRNLVDRAEAFAAIAEEREREGSPEGIEEGTEREATEGNVYAGRLRQFFGRGWSVPTTLSNEEVEGLTATVVVDIGPNLEIVSFRMRDGSGNALFDQSIMDQLARLQSTSQHLPPPPEAIAEEFINVSRPIRFHGRDAR